MISVVNVCGRPREFSDGFPQHLCHRYGLTPLFPFDPQHAASKVAQSKAPVSYEICTAKWRSPSQPNHKVQAVF